MSKQDEDRLQKTEAVLFFLLTLGESRLRGKCSTVGLKTKNSSDKVIQRSFMPE